LKDVHIRLDKHGLEGLTEKEMMVLLSEDIAESTAYLAEYLGGKIDALGDDLGEKIDNLGGKIDALGEKIDQSTAQITAKIDQSTAQMIEKIDQTVKPLHFWAKVIGSGLWAVAASLIAGAILLRACGG